MKFWRRLISSSIIALSLASCGGEKSPQQIDQQIRDSVVLITYPGEEGHGTGFFIPGPKGVCTVLTVNHVLPPDRGYRLQSHDDKIWEDVEIKRLKSLDLAVAIFRPEQKNCPYKSIPLGDSNQVQRGDPIHVLGYPAAAHQLDQHFVSGQVTAFTAPKPEGYAIAYNATTERGMSGAPVVDTRGKVIAVHGRTQVERQGGTPDSPDSVEVNTFKWSIPINTYIINKPAIIVETVDRPTVFPIYKVGEFASAIVIGVMAGCLFSAIYYWFMMPKILAKQKLEQSKQAIQEIAEVQRTHESRMQERIGYLRSDYESVIQQSRQIIVQLEETNATNQSRLAQYERELEACRQQITALEEREAASKSLLAQYERELEACRQQIASLEEREATSGVAESKYDRSIQFDY